MNADDREQSGLVLSGRLSQVLADHQKAGKAVNADDREQRADSGGMGDKKSRRADILLPANDVLSTIN